MKTFSFLLLLIFLLGLKGNTQNPVKPAMESFEFNTVLKKYSVENGKLNCSKTHRRFGKQALKWKWNGKSAFQTSFFRILRKKESPLKYGDFFPSSPTMVMSFYNETKKIDSLKVAFLKNNKENHWFTVPLNFTGWRTIEVPFFEMKGAVLQKGTQVDFDTFKISINTNTKGALYFDDIVFSQYQDDRSPYQDEIVPFVKASQDPKKDHWMPLISNIKRVQSIKGVSITNSLKNDLNVISAFIDKSIQDKHSNPVSIQTLQEEFAKFQLKDDGKTILGPPLTFYQSEIYFDKNSGIPYLHNPMSVFGDFMKKLAINYNLANTAIKKKQIEKLFLNGTRYVLDQGWQKGASGGTRHHIGYAVKKIAQAFYLMRKQLRKAQLLEQVGLSMQWLFNLGVILDDPSKFHVNLDYLNTQSFEHLMLIFLTENLNKQNELLLAYSNYISTILAQQNEEWGFKIDGTSWHHNGHYPAYGMGAFKSVPKIIKALSSTIFRIKKEGHENFRKAFLTTRLYSQLYDFGFGNAGRHPLVYNGNNIKGLMQHYSLMALSGHPSDSSKIDIEVAAAYLRLWGHVNNQTTNMFKDKGIVAEQLSGYFTLPYAATAIYRANNWAAIIKGYSKYIWSSEIYIASNRYGRYPANGTIQLLNEKGELGSGFNQLGWDWNRFPGATIIYLPIKQLETKKELLMFRSNETFAGSVTQNGNGVFGMILNESNGSNSDGDGYSTGFSGKLKAKKSVFSFGDKLICLGTNISSIDEQHPVQTNLFQTVLTLKHSMLKTSKAKSSKIPFSITLKNNDWIIDPYGNGYHILLGNTTQVANKHQQSYHNKYSLYSGKMNPKGKGVKATQGNFASGWIEHGLAPTKAQYQYVIYPFLSDTAQQHFAELVTNDNSYQIIQANAEAHVVLDKQTNTTCYVIFEANKKMNHGLVNQVSQPALLMLQEKDSNTLLLHATQPDLNFLEFKKLKYKNVSRPVELILIFKGKWYNESGNDKIQINYKGGFTKIKLQCQHGFSKQLLLHKN